MKLIALFPCVVYLTNRLYTGANCATAGTGRRQLANLGGD